MVLNGDGKSNIREQDSLEKIEAEENQFQIILCNPPFGTKIKEERIDVLRRFELGYEWIRGSSGWKRSGRLLDSQETGLLFTELCVRQVAPGGRVGIVVPNGYLGNRSPRYASFREWLLRNTRIVSIISLPRFTFKKSGADVSASLLFLEKRPRPLARLTTAGKYEFHVGMITSVGWTVVKRPERVWARDPETGAVLVDANNEPVPDADFNVVIADLMRSKARKHFSWLSTAREIAAGPPGWSINISVPLSDPDLSLDPKRLNRKFFEIRNSIRSKAFFKLGDVIDIIPESGNKVVPNKKYRYVQIQDIWDGGHSSSSLKGWDLPARARHAAAPGDIFAGKIWNSVGKWFMAGGETEDLVVTNGCYRLRIKEGKKSFLPDLISGMCTEAYRAQMRGYTTGSDGLAEISEQDVLEVVLPRLETQDARSAAERYLNLFLEGHASLRSFVSDLEKHGTEGYPFVPERKTVFVQV